MPRMRPSGVDPYERNTRHRTPSPQPRRQHLDERREDDDRRLRHINDAVDNAPQIVRTRIFPSYLCQAFYSNFYISSQDWSVIRNFNQRNTQFFSHPQQPLQASALSTSADLWQPSDFSRSYLSAVPVLPTSGSPWFSAGEPAQRTSTATTATGAGGWSWRETARTGAPLHRQQPPYVMSDDGSVSSIMTYVL